MKDLNLSHKNQTRSSNFELLHIVCMLFIVLGHLIMAHNDVGIAEYMVSHIIRPFSIVAVNVFVMISGYFGIKFKVDRLIKLCTQTWFYAVGAFFVVVVLGLHVIDYKKDFLVLFPVFSKQYWFVTAYIALYCIAPFFNEAIEKINFLTYKKGLLVGFLLFYAWPTFCFWVNAHQLVGDSGYGIVNFVYLYLLGRYIKLHYEDKKPAYFYLILYVISCFLLFLSQYLLSIFLGFEYSSWLSYNTIFVYFAAIFLFMCFKNISMNIQIINIIAAPCLAVYLFHMTPYGWNHLVDLLMIRDARGFVYIVMLLAYPFILYAVGFCIEKVRLFMGTWLENYICTLVGILIKKTL